MSFPTPTDAVTDAIPAERRIVIAVITITLLLASLPYALGYYIAPPGTRFVGTAYNIDDYCNYLSWLRQTMDGRFFLHNQFTTDPQRNLEFNVFFWGLGRFATLLHLSPQAALQIARVGSGAALLSIIYKFYTLVLPDNPRARLTALGFACLSSGFGWTTWATWHDKNLAGSPVDAWQPEAFTFHTLYTNALMTASTALIVAAMYALLRGEQTGQWKFPLIAGLCAALLGNMHSYDVLHLAAAWGLYLIVLTVINRGRGVAGSWVRGIAALVLALPTTVYQYHVFQSEAVFHARANTPTLSPPFPYYMAGYGLVFLLAVTATILFARQKRMRPAEGNLSPLLVTICWAVGGLAVIYLPVAFQRKMVMGTHVPLCLLAGLGAAALLGRWHVPPRTQNIVLAALVVLSMPSTLLFLARDMTHLTENRSETAQQPFLPATLVNCYAWLRDNTPPGTATVGPPPDCAALPGYAGRPVWAGHWAETPEYGTKVAAFARAMDSRATAADREAFLASTGAQYLLYPVHVSQMAFRDKHGRQHEFEPLAIHVPGDSERVYSNKDYALLRVVPVAP